MKKRPNSTDAIFMWARGQFFLHTCPVGFNKTSTSDDSCIHRKCLKTILDEIVLAKNLIFSINLFFVKSRIIISKVIKIRKAIFILNT